MAIFAPGKRDPHHRRIVTKRKIVATLTLTAMVDMFTVLTIFLLQNYNVTGQVLHIPKGVVLPKATEIKELQPSHVVTISPESIMLDQDTVENFVKVREQKDWLVRSLKDKLVQLIRKERLEIKQSLKIQLTQMVQADAKLLTKQMEDKLKKITVQADKNVDFLTIKKIMYTVTEAGISEINFAVIKKSPSEQLN